MGLFLSVLISPLSQTLNLKLLGLTSIFTTVIMRASRFKEQQVLETPKEIESRGQNLEFCDKPDSFVIAEEKKTVSKPPMINKKEAAKAYMPPAILLPRQAIVFSDPRPSSKLDDAATKVQKVYKSYRTRRNLADCAVVVEELWWKALDFAALSSVSFFNNEKSETALSRWSRMRTKAAKVGKGLSKDEKAQKLALQHWLEAIDPRHRYGHNLHFYYDIWSDSKSVQPFFYWLDVGEGKDLSHKKCSRAVLNQQCIRYLGPKEREEFEVVVENGQLVYKRSGASLNTDEASKWIFVLSTSRALYVGQKKKGVFQHSSFLSGGATTAAGRLIARDGALEAIWPYSGHYLPTEDNFKEFISFLKEHHVDLTNVKRYSIDENEGASYVTSNEEESTTSKPEELESEFTAVALDMKAASGIKTPRSEQETEKPVFDLAKRLSCKWSSGVGPRIGCVRDYPMELQSMALEQVNLSPRVGPAGMASPRVGLLPIPSPRPSPKIRVSPRLTYMGLPSPRPAPIISM